jgi:hypothetical protein
MSAGTIAGDRIRPPARPAPTPRVSPRPPSGCAVSSSISVPARPRCHRQASPGPAATGASHRAAPHARRAPSRAHRRGRPPASRKGAGESRAFRTHVSRQAGAGRHPGNHRRPGDHRRDSLRRRRSELAAFHGGRRSQGTSPGPGGRLVCGRRSAPGRRLAHRQSGIELPLAASECLQLPHPASPRARDRQALGLLEESPADRNLVMILTGPHDRLPSWPTAAPGLATGSPRSSTSRPPPAPYWLPSSPSEPTTPGKQAIVRRLPNCGIRNVQQRLPEIDTGRTLIARSSTGSVGPGERIGQRGDAGEHQQTLADRAQQNTCSGAAEESRRRPGLPTISAATRASGGGHVVAV